MRKIRIAQIGTSQNSHGGSIIKSLKKQNDLFEVVGYALPEDEREKFSQRMKDFDGLREMTVEEILSDPTIEAVTVETEEIYLTKYAQMVASAGKHMHMEKPGGQDPEAFEKMIETVRSMGTVFHTGYMYRYNPFVQELLRQIERGELGEILSVEAQMNCYHPASIRQWLENFKGGMMFFLGCHLIDLIFRIQGQPEKVTPYNRCSGLDGVTAEDQGMAVLEYKNGISFAVTNANQMGGYARRELVVTGSKKTVSLCPLEMHHEAGGQFTTWAEYSDKAWSDRGTSRDCPPHDRYDAMMASFAAMVRGEKENPYTLDYELALYKLVLECCGVKDESNSCK
jgi:predicted dehydrogenase